MIAQVNRFAMDTYFGNISELWWPGLFLVVMAAWLFTKEEIKK
jgi:hypothetical protein